MGMTFVLLVVSGFSEATTYLCSMKSHLGVPISALYGGSMGFGNGTMFFCVSRVCSPCQAQAKIDYRIQAAKPCLKARMFCIIPCATRGWELSSGEKNR